MNLIEKLGGYEKAKAKYDSRPFDLAWSDIRDALLEYRREHGIFEVGDQVVWKESLTMDKCLMEIIDKNGDTCGIRHATNEEIKAGHRL